MTTAFFLFRLRAALLCALGLTLAGLTPIAALADVPFVTGQTLSNLTLNNSTTQRGFKFTNTSGTTVTITQLGRWVISGNNQTHALSIYDSSPTPIQLATVTVNCAGATPGQFLYGTLTTPYVLAAGASCYIVSAETVGGDLWYSNGGTNLTTTDIGVIQSAFISTVATDGADNTRSLGPVSFQYSSPLPNWTKSGTVYTTDGSLYSVNSAIANASPGDTVNIPAGSFTWGSNGSYVTVNKAITLAGAGLTQTTINIAPTAGTYTSGAIGISAAATIRGFTITQSGAATTSAFIASTTDGWRITNIIYNSAATVGYFVFAGSYGLIDNCTLNLVSGSDEPIFARGPLNSWQTASSMGTANAVFIEDCTFNGPGYVCDMNSNARGVIRFCTINGTSKVDGHGLASNSPPRGVRQMEIYNNNWTTTVDFWTAIELRGGTGMIFDNAATGNTSRAWFYLTEYGYQAIWPNFGTYQTPANYPITDQIGVGIDPKAGGSEPVYVWNNLQGGVAWVRTIKAVAAGAITLFGSSFTERNLIQANRDFFADAGFDGAGNIGRGTKAAMLATSPATVGAGWWVTDEGSWNVALPANTSGQLYRWNGSVWVLFYLPYTYPHPVRKPGAAATLQITG